MSGIGKPYFSACFSQSNGAGAGAVVTRSFPDGYCVIAGTPAREVSKLDRWVCIEHKSKHKYQGFLRKADFAAFRRKHLNV